jgi:hypothetical protein
VVVAAGVVGLQPPWNWASRSARRASQLGQGGNPLCAVAEPVTAQDHLNSGGERVPHARPGGRRGAGRRWRGGDRLGQHRLDLVGGVAVGTTAAGGRPTIVGGPGDPEAAAGLGHAGGADPVKDLDTLVIFAGSW